MHTSLSHQAVENELQRVAENRRRIQDLHPCLGVDYPVAVASGSTLHVFTVEDSVAGYRFCHSVDLPMVIPQGVRAAFPLDVLNGAPACVITADALETPLGRVEIYHEFVHCYQWAGVEPELKESLELARRAAETGDAMWEINYPFPYEPGVAQAYRRWVATVEELGIDAARPGRGQFQELITELDLEYATWQEWKEGFARWVENRVRRRFGLPQNHNGRHGAFSRVAFYAGGAVLMQRATEADPQLINDLVGLRDLTRELA